nr:MAG TPA: hypothetical protein [Caudoviricetes sp.]
MRIAQGARRISEWFNLHDQTERLRADDCKSLVLEDGYDTCQRGDCAENCVFAELLALAKGFGFCKSLDISSNCGVVLTRGIVKLGLLQSSFNRLLNGVRVLHGCGSFLGVHYTAGFSRLDLLDVQRHLTIPEHLGDALVEGGVDTLVLGHVKGSRGLGALVLGGAHAEKHTQEGVDRSDSARNLGRMRQVPQSRQREVERRGSRKGDQRNPLEDVVGLVVQLTLLEMLSHWFSSSSGV